MHRARMMKQREVADHQVDRAKYIRKVEAAALLGIPPTKRDYVVYHCYEFIKGLHRIKSYKEWLNEQGFDVDGADVGRASSVSGTKNQEAVRREGSVPPL